MGRIVFVSDVHLHLGGREYMEVFLGFLERVGGEAEAVYIHGDLFDFYVGHRQGRLPFYAPLFERLSDLVAKGVRVFVLGGNRDFLLGRLFRENGVEVIPDQTTLELGGRRVHLSHGDQFCIHDHSYLFWARGVLRLPPIRFLVRNLPVSLAVWLARRYRGVSDRKRKRFARRSRGRLPSILDGVRLFHERDPHDVYICGHIHFLAETPIEAGGKEARLLTTGAWEDGPNCVLFDGEEFGIRRYDPHSGRLEPVSQA